MIVDVESGFREPIPCWLRRGAVHVDDVAPIVCARVPRPRTDTVLVKYAHLVIAAEDVFPKSWLLFSFGRVLGQDSRDGPGRSRRFPGARDELESYMSGGFWGVSEKLITWFRLIGGEDAEFVGGSMGTSTRHRNIGLALS